MQLRDYQVEMANGSIVAMNANKNPLIVAFTGGGKTVVLSDIAWRWNQEAKERVLILAHRRELIEQTQQKFYQYTGHRPAVEMGDKYATPWSCFDEPVVVGSVQTMQGKRLAKWPRDFFGLIITDEAHHAPSSTYAAIYDHFSNAKRLGVTATPDRLDKKPVISLTGGAPFDHLAANFDFQWGIDNCWLVEPQQRIAHVQGIDLSVVETKNGKDFTDNQVVNVMNLDKVVLGCVHVTFHESMDRPTLFFAVETEHAKHLSDVANHKFRPECCEYITAQRIAPDGNRFNTPPDFRERIVNSYRNGMLWGMSSCGVFTEGFDAPCATCIGMCRPTKSRSFYAQAVGRVLRPWQQNGKTVVDGLATVAERRAAIQSSPKPYAYVFDFTGNTGKHKLVHVLDLVAPAGTSEAVIARAKKIIEKSGEAKKPKEALEQAEAELRLRDERWREIRQQYEHEIDYVLEEFRNHKAQLVPQVGNMFGHYESKPTDKQKRALLSHGLSQQAVDAMSRDEASRKLTHFSYGPPASWVVGKLRRLGAVIPKQHKDAVALLNQLSPRK